MATMAEMKEQLEAKSNTEKVIPRDSLIVSIEAVCADIKAYDEVSTGSEQSVTFLNHAKKMLEFASKALTSEKAAYETSLLVAPV